MTQIIKDLLDASTTDNSMAALIEAGEYFDFTDPISKVLHQAGFTDGSERMTFSVFVEKAVLNQIQDISNYIEHHLMHEGAPDDQPEFMKTKHLSIKQQYEASLLSLQSDAANAGVVIPENVHGLTTSAFGFLATGMIVSALEQLQKRININEIGLSMVQTVKNMPKEQVDKLVLDFLGEVQICELSTDGPVNLPWVKTRKLKTKVKPEFKLNPAQLVSLTIFSPNQDQDQGQ